VLEAMKMKNAIRATRAGRIADIAVSVGQQVNHGDPLLSFAE
jgi:biotin carboxyl carrier protein